jgi:hypothetical protein
MRTLVGEDALPLAVTGLLLEEAGEIHDLTRFVFGEVAHDFDQLFCNCRHVHKLTPPLRTGKRVLHRHAARQKLLRHEKSSIVQDSLASVERPLAMTELNFMASRHHLIRY